MAARQTTKSQTAATNPSETPRSTSAKTAATKRSTTAKKAAASRARRAVGEEARKTRTQVKRSSTGAGRQADRAEAKAELGVATVNNAIQGAVGAGFRGAATVVEKVRKAF